MDSDVSPAKDFPEQTRDSLSQRARTRAESRGYQSKYDEAAFLDVAGLLWLNFRRGVRDEGGWLPEPDSIEEGVLLDNIYKQAISQDPNAEQSGDLIADCVPLWRDDEFPGREPVTEYCAYVCGVEAANISRKSFGGRMIDKDIFALAFKETQKTMRKKLKKARCHYKGPDDDRDDYRAMGAGC